ncbi:hypothetical protein EYZ11_003923 [Aspergillus tanneri]|uniref:GPI anchored protein n=1 Tax=Aspergillus tanneri TaxID=1220188 RepID=A0A4S3JM66_9EURO|nr:hypothetical protein EYZ11_003923 [Aspergillus tanneri]
MILTRALSLLVASCSIHHCLADADVNADVGTNQLPTLSEREFTPLEEASLVKRNNPTCPDGGTCLLGNCCGSGCAANCCGHDDGGVGCGITEQCKFDGNVFIGCCANVFGCTGTATRITIHTPYSTVTFRSDSPATAVTAVTTDAGESLRLTSTSTSTSTSLSAEATPTSTTDTSTSSKTTRESEIESSTATTTSSGVTSERTHSHEEQTPTRQDSSSSSSSTSGSDSEATPNAAVGMTYGVEMGLFALGAWVLGST